MRRRLSSRPPTQWSSASPARTRPGALAPAPNTGWTASLPPFVANGGALGGAADVLFACLGHDGAAALAPPADAVVVDLSGAHRLRDSALYDSWYGFTHPRAETL